ncbi:glycoside hydrolase family 18 protein [Gymnopus androsaceus JB14]|uniref:chitinase n=1 Tax=Gymnopus androsaceus JB14 TaxID=1447944 RepID=A0A6A4IQA1_9AGAR|nr:glycoside hydrolase family 18 protein [Gymnopus androsaceus JB14]
MFFRERSRTMMSLLAILGFGLLGVHGYNAAAYDNVVSYWGQNSYGATHTDVVNFQQPLGFYCGDDAVDVFPIAFLDDFFSTGGLPSLNLATCNPTDNATFTGTQLPDCSALASDIETCQAAGKLVTISLGGANGGVGFTDDTEATTFAQTIWNLFLGGSSTTRPFGAAVLDGVDLDIEQGGSTGYAAFVTEIRSLSAGASKPYYITGAPQCVFPDASLGSVIDAVGFDAIYVQFYNNQCGIPNFNTTAWNFGVWDNWARTTSPNPNVKVFLGAPAALLAAGSGYVDPDTLSTYAIKMRNSFPSFGGVMLWDESQAYVNDRYDLAIKNALVAAGATGFTFPPCTAPEFVPGTAYTGGETVSFGGYIFEAKFFATDTPSNDPNGDWSAISACGGPSVPPSSTTSTTLSSTSTTSTTKTSTTVTSTTSSASSSPTSGACAGIAAWSNLLAYVGGSQVTFEGDLWTSLFWSEASVPGGTSGVWVNDGPCTTTRRSVNSRFFL